MKSFALRRSRQSDPKRTKRIAMDPGSTRSIASNLRKYKSHKEHRHPPTIITELRYLFRSQIPQSYEETRPCGKARQIKVNAGVALDSVVGELVHSSKLGIPTRCRIEKLKYKTSTNTSRARVYQSLGECGNFSHGVRQEQWAKSLPEGNSKIRAHVWPLV